MTRVVVYTDSLVVGGAERFARNLLAGLRPPFEPAVVGLSPEVVSHIASGRPGTRAEVLPPVSRRWDLLSLHEQARALRRFDADVVHVNRNLWTGQWGVLASALAGVPSICVVHGVLPALTTSQGYLTMATDRLAQRFVGVSHFVSAQIRRELRLTSRRVRTIYNGIPKELPAAADHCAPAARSTVLGVGRLAHEKGFDLLIKAMAQLPGRSLVLVGDGPERRALEALATDLGLAERVQFAGWVDEPWTIRFAPELLVVPSRFEAMPLVLLEAMRAGIAVVATRVGGVPELVVDNVTGTLVEPENPTSLAVGIRTLLEEPKRRAATAAAARRRFEQRFTDSSMLAAYEALYAEVADREGARRFGRSGRSDRRLRAVAQVVPPESRERALRMVEWTTRRIKASALAPPLGLDRGNAELEAGPAKLVLEHLAHVRGRVLVFGSTRVADIAKRSAQELVVCDLEPRNFEASLIVDLFEEGTLGEGEFDCELVVGEGWQPPSSNRALTSLWKALRPGGSLLLALPSAGSGGAGFTDATLRSLLERFAPSARIEVLPLAPSPVDSVGRTRSKRSPEWLGALVQRAAQGSA